MRYFVAVAEELNFRRAADRLHLAQPALSAQIKQLEQELGAQLLERTTRTVNLTPAGRVFLEQSRDVLMRASLAAEATRKVGSGLSGRLRLGLVTLSATPTLAAALRRFHHKFPNVQITVSDHTSSEQLHLLRHNELDVGLLRPPVPFPELACRDFEQAYRVLAAPSGHRLARKAQLEWKDFDGEGLVMIQAPLQHRFYDEFLAACSQAGAKVHPAQYAQDISSKLWLISAGFGIAPTTAAVSRIKRPGLVFRPLPPGLPVVKTVLAWRRDALSPVVRNFLDCLETISPDPANHA